MFAQLFGEFDCTGGNKIDVLAHACFAHVSINSLSAEHNSVIAPAQEIEHGVMDCRQRQRLAHGKFLECKRSGVEHRSNNTLLSCLFQDSPSWSVRRSFLPQTNSC